MGSELWLRYNLRGGGLAVSTAALTAVAIEQAVWAERHGFDVVTMGEHHGTEDGYLPSPMIVGAAMAARTKRIRFNMGAILLPLLNPLRVAEDVCVFDNVSNGRVDITAGAGYVPSEFDMFGVDYRQRIRSMEEGIATLRAAFSGTPFDYQGRRVRISPAPVQPGGPKIMIGGGVTAAALRAARIGDGFFPTVAKPELLACYHAECARLGRASGRVVTAGAGFIHVSHDPERDWQRIGRHLLHDLNAYAKWARESGAVTPYLEDVSDIEALKKTGVYLVLTPDECLAFMQAERAADRSVMFNPLCGGLHPDLAWESLELLAAEVLPRYGQVPVRPAAAN